MKKLLIIALLVLVATTANAYTFTDTIDYWNLTGTSYGETQTLSHGYDSVLVTEGSPLSYIHDITDSVNFAAGDLVTTSSLQLDFTNDLLDAVFTGWLSFLPNTTEHVYYGFDGSAWHYLGEVDNGAYNIGVDTALLNVDGKLVVSLSVTNYDNGLGTAYLDHSILSGTAEIAPVPEPGTVLLLGAGLFGLALYTKRRANEA